jgi:arylsulfatase A-like enzyme
MKKRHWSRVLARLSIASSLLSLPILSATVSIGGCATDTGSAASEGDEEVGSLGIDLTVAPGVTIDEVSYEIEGNGFTKSGTIDSSGAPTIAAKIGGIPAGSDYTITLTAISVEGDTTFTGSAEFDIVAGETSAVEVDLEGTSVSGNGSVAVTGTINVRPVIEELTASPLSAFLGSAISLSSVSRDPDEHPADLAYYWSTTGGVIDDPIAPNAVLTSETPGTFEITLTVSDGVSSVTATQSVTFVNPDAPEVAEAPEHPNVLFILIDDLGAAATSIYPDLAGAAGQAPLPNIEALAESGLVFDNAWSSPACSPTRGTIVTGQYGFRTTLTNVGNVLPIDTVTIWDRLNEDTDYVHGVFGKYHIGGGLFDPRAGVAYPIADSILQHIRDIGIKTFKGVVGGAVVDLFDWTPYDINVATQTPTRTYGTTELTNIAIDFIHEQEVENPDKPWFIFQSYNAPHASNGPNSPYQVPPADLHSIDLSSAGNPRVGAYVTNIPVYQANIQALDTELGRLLAEVDLATTTVIFSGDNGVPPPVTDAGQNLRGSKGSVYEGGVRVPFFAAGAGVTRRGRDNSLVGVPDVFATVLDFAGADVSADDSYSIKKVVRDETAHSGRVHSYTEIGIGAQHRYAIKDTRFKLAYPAAGRFELYDLVNDPLETTNLYDSAPHAAALASLKAELAELEADASSSYFP